MATTKKPTLDTKERPLARARSRVESDEGVLECMRLMASGQWVRGITVLDIAKRHGIAVDTAKEWSARASSLIRLSIEADKEDIRARMLATLDTIISLNASSEKGGKVAVAAIAEQGKLLGLTDAKPQVAVQVNVKNELAALDDVSMLDKIEAQIAKLTSVRDRLRDKVWIAKAELPAHEENDDD